MIEYNFWWKVVTNISLRYLLLATLTFVVCYFLLRKPLSKRKIQQAFPRMNDYARDIVFSLFSIIIFSSIA
ncbi:MAG TPA: hypothetical protein VLL95_01525, partial [Phnomibacter sp.]|nr:hypothetical protein [Phnomibacter sp.]